MEEPTGSHTASTRPAQHPLATRRHPPFWPVRSTGLQCPMPMTPVRCEPGRLQDVLTKLILRPVDSGRSICFANISSSPRHTEVSGRQGLHRNAATPARARVSQKHSPGLGSALGPLSLRLRTDSKTAQRNS